VQTTTTTTTDAPHVKRGRTRALSVAGGALAAALAWNVEVRVLLVHLTFRFGAGPAQTVAIGEVIGVSAAASLLGWLLLALLERRTRDARRRWTTIALAVLAASLALPLTAATTGSAVAGLIALHLTVGVVVIPALAHTARGR
jgi:hypothetical protein